MKTYHKLLIAAGAAMIILGAVAVPVLHADPPAVVNCCDWEGTGSNYLTCNGTRYYFFQHWHANVAWRSSDTTTDTIIGCWYDDDGHGGNIFGYRVHATDSAFGVAYANGSDDDYCSDSIDVVPQQTIGVTWKAKWTGCCDEANPDVDGEWTSSGGGCTGSGDFDDSDYTCYDLYNVCE